MNECGCMIKHGHREVEFLKIPVTTYVRLAHARWLPAYLRPAAAPFAIEANKVMYPVEKGAVYFLSTLDADPDKAINKTLDKYTRAVSAA